MTAFTRPSSPMRPPARSTATVSTAADRFPTRPRGFSRRVSTALPRSSTRSPSPGPTRAGRASPSSARRLYELHVGTFTPEGTFAGRGDAAAASGRPRRHRDRADAGRRLPGRSQLGLRRRRPRSRRRAATARPTTCAASSTPRTARASPCSSMSSTTTSARTAPIWRPSARTTSRHAHQTPGAPASTSTASTATPVRDFFIENALHWVHEFHIDGLRLDATHAIVDDSPTALPGRARRARARVAAGARRGACDRRGRRNLARMVKPRARGGWGLDGVWADDFHHQMRRALAGDTDGYYRRLRGTAAEHRGHGSARAGSTPASTRPTGDGPRGHRPGRHPAVTLRLLPPESRPDRQSRVRRTAAPSDRPCRRTAPLGAAAVLPETPLLFMGQEWAASSPFQFFTDHEAGSAAWSPRAGAASSRDSPRSPTR